MTAKTILQAPATILSEVAREVTGEDFDSGLVARVVKHLTDTLDATKGSAGLAAPQIGYGIRIIAVRKGAGYWILINPEIISIRKPKWMGEQCLSVAHGKRNVRRWRGQRARVEYMDETRQYRINGTSDLRAQVVQHECDHLDGITLLDPQEKR